MSKHRLESLSLPILFIGISVLLFFVFSPFLSLLSLAAVLAILLHRPYEYVTQKLGGWKNSIAVFTVALVLLFFIVPIFFLGMQIYNEASGLYLSMQGNGTNYLYSVQTFIESPLQKLFPGFTFNIYSYIGNILVLISNNLGSLVYQTFYIIFETFLMLLAFFFFLRDGRRMVASFSKVSPLGLETTREVLANMYTTITSVIQGTFVNALIRWLGIWAAFAIFNIPNALLWSSMGGIIGAIPGLGTPFAFIPAVLYLYVEGHVISAVGLALVGVGIIMLVDNILTSYFFGRGLAISPVFVLFSILGGIFFFGPLGFILGPLVLSIFLSVVHVSPQVSE
ncbi:MAG TPA: AI-2E family transporter [Candidatus Paceibacterota bacterium]|nr:AI-2E family transporter [Candidatus Paceibacterota bacterium]